MIQETRIQPLNENRPTKGEYVLYWMQASQRANYNHALEYAIDQANQRKQPIFVYFGLTESFPEANERHYCFMLEGLKEVQQTLIEKGIGMIIERCSPERGAVKLGKRATLVVCDRGYLKTQKKWRYYVSKNLECPLIQVETDIVVPVEVSSTKEEYSAATLRSKLIPALKQYFAPLREEVARIDSTRHKFTSYDISDTALTLSKLAIDRSVKPSPTFRGGAAAARRHLDDFVGKRLDSYGKGKNDPNSDSLSNLSPYLHFGQISPLFIALEVSSQGGHGSEAFLEELITRRELAINFVNYNHQYDTFAALPDWAINTLSLHTDDKREYKYPLEELEQAMTHDPYWNAAQREMLLTGKMHGYMRMYWGKKLLEWTATPREGFEMALHLNNKYELDGRDANGFAGVAWCFGKHDRPWPHRPIFGNVRYMNAQGLKRKFDADQYARKYSSAGTKRPMDGRNAD